MSSADWKISHAGTANTPFADLFKAWSTCYAYTALAPPSKFKTLHHKQSVCEIFPLFFSKCWFVDFVGQFLAVAVFILCFVSSVRSQSCRDLQTVNFSFCTRQLWEKRHFIDLQKLHGFSNGYSISEMNTERGFETMRAHHWHVRAGETKNERFQFSNNGALIIHLSGITLQLVYPAIYQTQLTNRIVFA